MGDISVLSPRLAKCSVARPVKSLWNDGPLAPPVSSVFRYQGTYGAAYSAAESGFPGPKTPIPGVHAASTFMMA